MNKYLSRKFIIAFLFTIAGCVGFLACGKLSGGEFVSLALGITGLFGAGDVAMNIVHKKNSEDQAP